MLWGSVRVKEEEMRRVTVSILTLALVVAVVGCGSMQVNIREPQSARLTFRRAMRGWSDRSETLPTALVLGAHRKYSYRISDIPLNEGVEVYARVKTYGTTPFTKAGQVPIVINAQDVQDVVRGNVVRIVVVDPKREFQTSQFESLRLSPTDDAVMRAKEIGDPILLVTLGNRDPFAK